jgi:hypothetical protein
MACRRVKTQKVLFRAHFRLYRSHVATYGNQRYREMIPRPTSSGDSLACGFARDCYNAFGIRILKCVPIFIQRNTVAISVTVTLLSTGKHFFLCEVRLANAAFVNEYVAGFDIRFLQNLFHRCSSTRMEKISWPDRVKKKK